MINCNFFRWRRCEGGRYNSILWLLQKDERRCSKRSSGETSCNKCFRCRAANFCSETYFLQPKFMQDQIQRYVQGYFKKINAFLQELICSSFKSLFGYFLERDSCRKFSKYFFLMLNFVSNVCLMYILRLERAFSYSKL